jgi:hypothetical protein
MAQLYTRALGSLFIAPYDLQGYGGGIRTHLHMGTDSMKVKVKVKVTLHWRPTANQFILASRYFRITTTEFFQLNPCGNSPYVTFSLTRWVCLLWICFAFRQVSVSHIKHVENSSFCTIYKSSVCTGFVNQVTPILRILCYNGSLVTWTAVSLTTTKFKPLIQVFSMPGFTLSYIANMFILIILYDLCFLPAKFCHIIIYIRKVESRMQNADRCAPWKISNGTENLVL